jgi:hypothetical protein
VTVTTPVTTTGDVKGGSLSCRVRGRLDLVDRALSDRRFTFVEAAHDRFTELTEAGAVR